MPIYINPNTGKFRKSSTITLGARGDSYYEYLLKQWIQTGKTQDYLKADFLESMRGVATKLSKRTLPNRLLFVGELISSKQFKPKMDELVCFLPGTLALASHHGMTLEAGFIFGHLDRDPSFDNVMKHSGYSQGTSS